MKQINQKTIFFLIAVVFFIAPLAFAQESGNVVYSGAPTRRLPADVIMGNLSGVEPQGTETTQFIEAYVLMNAKADAYIAVFGASKEGATPAESNNKLDAQINAFIADIKALGIKDTDIFVDLTTQNRIYDFVPQSGTNRAQEVFKGFETKKTIAVRYTNRDVLIKLSAAAARASIFDLIKVDYVVSDLNTVRERLFAEAAKIIKRKEASYASALSVRMVPAAVFQEKFRIYSPSELYLSYQAFETGTVDYDTRAISQRKSKTFYYQPLRTDDFDLVMNPMGVEPMVQCTLYLRAKYTVGK